MYIKKTRFYCVRVCRSFQIALNDNNNNDEDNNVSQYNCNSPYRLWIYAKSTNIRILEMKLNGLYATGVFDDGFG